MSTCSRHRIARAAARVLVVLSLMLSHARAGGAQSVPAQSVPAQSVPAQSVPSDSAIRAILKTRVDSGTAKGLVVGVLEHGNRRFIAYGSAGPGRAPLDQHTIFEIGSISKTFTSLLLADATARGEVTLDEPVARLLPRGTTVPALGTTQITLEHLATHRSGLPRLPDNFAPSNVNDPYADYDVTRLYAFLASYRLQREPGASAEYSNVGGGLLGHALTVRTGSPSWGALVERRITGPLGMHDTYVDVPATARQRVALGYDERLDSTSAWHLDALAGAGALRSTADDMLTYLAAYLDTTAGPLAHAAALARVPRANFAANIFISLGWLVSGLPDHPMWWHNGGTGGFRSFAAFDPARQTAVVVLANNNVSIDDVGMHLLNPSIEVGLPIRAPRASVTLTIAQLDRLVGEYPLSPIFSLAVTREDDTLFVQATGQPKLKLFPASPNHFVIPSANAEIVFDISEPGPARHLSLRQNGGMVTAPRK